MLKLSHISKTFNPGTVNEKVAIRDLSLHLEKGDFATIIGSNGAGKSTMFNAICGDFLTDSGSVVLDGEDITFMPQHVRAKNIGRLYQDPMRGTAPGMTILENLALAAGQGGDLLGDLVPGGLGIDGQAGVHAHGQIEGLPQLAPELGGDEQTALGIDAVLVCAGHVLHSSPLRLHFAGIYSTLPHSCFLV